MSPLAPHKFCTEKMEFLCLENGYLLPAPWLVCFSVMCHTKSGLSVLLCPILTYVRFRNWVFWGDITTGMIMLSY